MCMKYCKDLKKCSGIFGESTDSGKNAQKRTEKGKEIVCTWTEKKSDRTCIILRQDAFRYNRVINLPADDIMNQTEEIFVGYILK